ncbi:2OG-Fe dioxygenase family protein [Caldimonas brevitalea]|nr:2OG-Fe dioxygenase family protein [Caldimonas brevitalea]
MTGQEWAAAAPETEPGDVRAALQQRGWARFDATDMQVAVDEAADLQRLTEYARSLPVDRFGTGGRHRSYAEGILTPRRKTIAWKAGARTPDGRVEIAYVQHSEFQPEHGGVVRNFARTREDILALPLVHRLIWYDLSLTPMFDAEGDLLCGFHMIRMQATPGAVARITPDCLHQDGQPFTAVHLVERSHAEGGVNFIAPPRYTGRQFDEVPSHLLSAFVLGSPLQSYIIDDAAICHQVTAVSCSPGASHGTRTVILIDFSPLNPASSAQPT